MNVLRLDLNLAVALEAIMLERNVTRAAAGLAMSQPAVSNALRRARQVTGDQLFVRTAAGVTPTSHMLAIWPDLQQALGMLRAALAPDGFDPQSSAASFRVAVTDSLEAEAVPAITLALRRAAPAARVAFVPHTNAGSLERIERGTLDCAVGMFPSLPRHVRVLGLVSDHYVCVMRRGHPLARRLSLDAFLGAPHLLVTPSGLDLGAVDGWLGLQGRSRNIVAVVNRFADALRIVAETDLLTCVPHGFLETEAARATPRRNLAVRALPFDAERLLYKLVWHERQHAHPAHQWFRALVAAACGAGAPAPRGAALFTRRMEA